jgi:hypothetical protein
VKCTLLLRISEEVKNWLFGSNWLVYGLENTPKTNKTKLSTYAKWNRSFSWKIIQFEVTDMVLIGRVILYES